MGEQQQGQQREAEAQAAQATQDEHPLEEMNRERQERQGLQSELEDQPKGEQANQDANEMGKAQSQGETGQQQR